MPTASQRPSSSSRDLTLVVESASGTPEEYFAQVNISIGRAKSNTIHIDHPDVDHIHAKVVKREEAFWLQCEGQAKLQVLDPEPGEVGEVELIPGLAIELGGVTIRCRRQMRGMSSLSDDYWAEAAGGEQFRVETDSFTGNLPKKIGPYEIRKFVARGGMGIVLRGVHEETDLLAAVKLPTPDLNKDQEWLKRFEQEVRTLKSVTHPNLVRLQDAGKEGDLHWMAMDWVEGWTVGERLTVYKEAGELMPMQEIQLVLKQVVEGLATLHSQGVVHRDLKPGNLLVGQDGGVKVADFGLAKQVGGEQSTFLTRTGTFAGTMHYMAPEQAEGGDITPATDVYALGVIWYELLTSKRPSGKFKLTKLRPDCPERWTSLIEDCLDDEPTDRPPLSIIMESLLSSALESGRRISEARPPQEPEPQELRKDDKSNPLESDPTRPAAHDISEVVGIIGASGARWVKQATEAVSTHTSSVREKLKKKDDPLENRASSNPKEKALVGRPWVTYALLSILFAAYLWAYFHGGGHVPLAVQILFQYEPYEIYGDRINGWQLPFGVLINFVPTYKWNDLLFENRLFFFVVILLGFFLLWWVSKATEKGIGRRKYCKLLGAIYIYTFALYLSLYFSTRVTEVGPGYVLSSLFPEGIDALLLPLAGCLWVTHRICSELSMKVPRWFLLLLALYLCRHTIFGAAYWVIEGWEGGLVIWNASHFLSTASGLGFGLALGYLMNRSSTPGSAAWNEASSGQTKKQPEFPEEESASEESQYAGGLKKLWYSFLTGENKPSKLCPKCGKKMFQSPRGNWLCGDC